MKKNNFIYFYFIVGFYRSYFLIKILKEKFISLLQIKLKLFINLI